MGLSKKAINKFAKFTATKPPSYKYNRLGTLASIKKGLDKGVLLKRINSRASSVAHKDIKKP
jgi:hypothetical protein